MRTGQLDLLDPPAVAPPDPPVVREIKRLDASAMKVLARLQQGHAYNTDLNEIAFRYGARIWDLKQHGYRIAKAHIEDGLWIYWLQGRA